MPLSKKHHLFIQAMMNRHVLPLQEAEKLANKCCEVENAGLFRIDKYTQRIEMKTTPFIISNDFEGYS